MERAEDEKMSQRRGEREGSITEGDGEDVDGQPKVTPEYGDEGIEGWVKNSGLKVGSDQSKDHDRGGGEEVGGSAMASSEKYGKKGGAERDPKNTFVHIGDGRAAGDPDADGKTRHQQ